jgi:hypothetical protein
MQTAQSAELIDSKAMTVEGIANLMVRQFDIDSAIDATHYIYAHAQILTWLMAKHKDAFDWTNKPIFDELHTTSIPSDVLGSATKIRLRRRRDTWNDTEDSSDVGVGDDSSLFIRTPHKGKGKSILRPISSKFSGKGKNIGEYESDSSHLTLTTPTKRKADQLLYSSQLNKRIAPNDPLHDLPSDEGIDVEDSDEEYLGNLNNGTTLPIRWKNDPNNHPENDDLIDDSCSEDAEPLSPVADTASLTMVSETMPEFTANSAGDVWACPWDGCLHKVYNASSEESVELMREHYQRHITQRDQQIDIVKREAGHNMPVGNLIKLIRHMAEKQRLTEELNPQTPTSGVSAATPKPIQRRY